MAISQTRILLLSRESRTALRIERILSTLPGVEIISESNSIKARRLVAQGDFQCLVLNLEEFDFRQYNLIEQIRKLGHNFPIFVFADQVNGAASDSVEALHNVTVFSRILVDLDRDFLGLFSRFMKTEKSVKRSSKRHDISQKGLVENSRTGNRFTCLANNLSRGGVSIEFHAGSLQVNDMVKITIQLPHLKKAHLMIAKVVWYRISNLGVRSAGLRFEAASKEINQISGKSG